MDLCIVVAPSNSKKNKCYTVGLTARYVATYTFHHTLIFLWRTFLCSARTETAATVHFQKSFIQVCNFKGFVKVNTHIVQLLLQNILKYLLASHNLLQCEVHTYSIYQCTYVRIYV